MHDQGLARHRERHRLHRVAYLAAVLTIVALVAGLYAYLHNFSKTERTGGPVIVCSAGSLAIPLQELAHSFEEKYGIKVLLEPSGSVEAVRKVTDFGRNCDVVAVADYRLIPMFMVPRFAKWYIAFATNSIVVAYTKDSKYASEVAGLRDPLGVFKVLSRSDVEYGFSDPNRDPCGYRSVGVIGLVALETHNLSLLKTLVISKIPGSSYRIVNGTLHIYVPAGIEPRGNLVIRPKEVDLVSLLESGAIDYAFEYRSVAVQHGLRYIELPSSVNLADPALAREYSRVVVHILVGTDKEKAITMAPIVYGVTVPVNAEHPRAALLFVKYLLEHGEETFARNGQQFLQKPLGYGDIPEELRGIVRLEES